MNPVNSTPQFSVEEAAAIVDGRFGISCSAKLLASERDQNFRITSSEGSEFVLKVANGRESREKLEAQNGALLHLQGKVDCTPTVVLDSNDAHIVEVESAETGRHLVRLMTFLPGTVMASEKRHSPELMRNLGEKVGQIDRALASYDHPALHYDFHWDLANAAAVVEQHQHLIPDDQIGGLVRKISNDYVTHYASRIESLPKSIIHNDANDHNVVVGGGGDLFRRNQTVCGIIDFGDMIYSYSVGGLAIAIAYAVLDKTDPLAVACQVVSGYCAAAPLSEEELALVWPLALMRLCTSAAMAGFQMQQRPDDPYLVISQGPIQRTLPKLQELHPRFVEVAFRLACGMDGSASRNSVVDYLKQANASDVLGIPVNTDNAHLVDLSVSSGLLHGPPWETDTPAMSAAIEAELSRAGKPVGIGRYGEARLIYNDDAFKMGDKLTDERRTIHLGVDLFVPAGTTVRAPLPGTVYAAVACPAPLDYGHAMVLEHATDEGTTFYTLFGHLSRGSLSKVKVGQRIEAGATIGWIGDEDENGGWPTHLHLQIVTDMLDRADDFPAIAPASQEAIWREFLPTPNLLLKLPEETVHMNEPSKAETHVRRLRITGRNLSLGYRDHVKVARGWQQYLYDETGRRYVDAYNNVPHVGHCHPHVVEAIRRQAGILNTNTRYLQDTFNRYAERLAATFPEPLNVAFILNSGSEANELALRLAHAATGERDLIVNEGAYHGHTSTLIDISPYKHDGPGGEGAPDWVHTIPVADVYRGRYGPQHEDAGLLYADELLPVIDRVSGAGRGLAGFIHETCPSVGGQIIFPCGYLAAAYEHVRAAGGVCIADEVQTGFGRTGDHFYAFTEQGVIPDIVVLGKPIGNGHPLAAVITTRAIADAFDTGMEYFATFGGNSVSCAAGLAVLEVLEDGVLQKNAREVGDYLFEGLKSLQQQFELIGDVRGAGFFLGVELVKDRTTLEPAAAEASYVANRMRDFGILLGTDGPLHNVVKIRPPMPFGLRDANLLLERMEHILCEIR